MEYEILVTFAGPLCSGKRGKFIELKDKDLVKDLLNAGFIRPVKAKKSNTSVRGKETL